METILDIGKWVLVVFIGGVIAGFGKMLASWLIRRRRSGAQGRKCVEAAVPVSETGEAKENRKLEKKLRKALIKREKKKA